MWAERLRKFFGGLPWSRRDLLSDQSCRFPRALKRDEGLVDMAGGMFGGYRDADAAGGARNGRWSNCRSIHAFREQGFGKRERSVGIADENRHDRTGTGGQSESQLSQS
jgi:hypothetical protein